MKTNLVAMGKMVDDRIGHAFHALFTGDMGEAAAVIARDREVDTFDSMIERQCQQIFVSAQPVAADLRLLMAALNINSQFERIGDIAVNVAERVRPLVSSVTLMKEARLAEMAEIAQVMVSESLDSFLKNDPASATRVLEYDDVVDGLNRSIFQFLVAEMQADNRLIEPGSHMLILSRHIERLADHATNIAEDVIFLVEARQVKHHAGEQETGGRGRIKN